jgi:sporulation protein YlmC with PRC-barrel domain
MRPFVLAATCAALLASAPAFAQSSPGGSPAAANPASPSASPSTNALPSNTSPASCQPGQVLQANGQPCPSGGSSGSAQAPAVPSPGASPSTTAQAPSTPPPGTSPSTTAQAPATPSPGAPPSTTAQVPQEGTPAVQTAGNFIDKQSDNEYLASNLMGKTIQDTAGDKIGAVKDILFDDQGKMTAFVIGVGGFLGIGEKSIAVAVDVVKPSRDGKGDLMLTASLDKDAINAAPDFMTLDDQKARTPSNVAPPPANPPPNP